MKSSKNANKHLQDPLQTELDEEHNNTGQYCNSLHTSEEPKTDLSKVILHYTAVSCCPESGTLDSTTLNRKTNGACLLKFDDKSCVNFHLSDKGHFYTNSAPGSFPCVDVDNVANISESNEFDELMFIRRWYRKS